MGRQRVHPWLQVKTELLGSQGGPKHERVQRLLNTTSELAEVHAAGASGPTSLEDSIEPMVEDMLPRRVSMLLSKSTMRFSIAFMRR